MRSNVDASELDAMEQLVGQLEQRQPGDISSLDPAMLARAQAVCRRVVDDWDLDEPVRERAALLSSRAIGVKVAAAVAQARGYVPRLCSSCSHGHRSHCLTCTRGELVTVKVPGHVRTAL